MITVKQILKIWPHGNEYWYCQQNRCDNFRSASRWQITAGQASADLGLRPRWEGVRRPGRPSLSGPSRWPRREASKNRYPPSWTGRTAPRTVATPRISPTGPNPGSAQSSGGTRTWASWPSARSRTFCGHKTALSEQTSAAVGFWGWLALILWWAPAIRWLESAPGRQTGFPWSKKKRQTLYPRNVRYFMKNFIYTPMHSIWDSYAFSETSTHGGEEGKSPPCIFNRRLT